jgi:hypothetical protein
MVRACALVVVCVLALVVLGPASAQRTRFGGTLTVGIAIGDPSSRDPAFNLGGGIEVLPWLCEQLYVFNAKSQIAPQIASALPTISRDDRAATRTRAST